MFKWMNKKIFTILHLNFSPSWTFGRLRRDWILGQLDDPLARTRRNIPSGVIPMCMGSVMFLHKKMKIFQSTSNTTLNNSTIKMSAEVKHMSQCERHHLRACSEKAPISSGFLLSDNKEDAK